MDGAGILTCCDCFSFHIKHVDFTEKLKVDENYKKKVTNKSKQIYVRLLLFGKEDRQESIYAELKLTDTVKKRVQKEKKTRQIFDFGQGNIVQGPLAMLDCMKM